MRDPKDSFPDGSSTDFIIKLEQSENILTPLEAVPWSVL